jgi:hypothetical protein
MLRRIETEIESVGRDLIQELAKLLRSESGPRVIALMVLSAIGGVALLVSALPLAGADAWIFGVTLSVFLVAFIALVHHHLGNRPPFYLEHSALAKNPDPRLEKGGRVGLARVVDLDVVTVRRRNREDEIRYYLLYRFTVGEAGDRTEIVGRVRVGSGALIDAGRHPEPAMMVGELIQVRYLPSRPGWHWVESLRSGPDVPEVVPELPALPDEETSASPRREDEGDVTHPPLPGASAADPLPDEVQAETLGEDV